MRLDRLHIISLAILLCLISGLVIAQESASETSIAASFDYNRDRLQYEGQPITSTAASFDYNRDRLQYEGQTFKPIVVPFDYNRDRLQYEGQPITSTATSFDYNRDRLQYEGQIIAPSEEISGGWIYRNRIRVCEWECVKNLS